MPRKPDQTPEPRIRAVTFRKKNSMQKILIPIVLSFLLAGCSREKGDKPIARGEGAGYTWSSDVAKDTLRVSAQNSFSQTSYVALDGSGTHYELEIGPVRDAFMIVPAGEYEFSAWTYGRSVGETKFTVTKDDRGISKGFLVQIRP